MKVHVLPGDSLAAEFNKTKIKGRTVVCRECLVVGPVEAADPNEFWEVRAHFILTEYGEDEIEYHERVADELETLRDLDRRAEVNLWFEYELFCSVNMWFCLSLLSRTGATVYRVEPVTLAADDRWKGFGSMASGELSECYNARRQFAPEDIRLGSDLWDAFRQKDLAALRRLGDTPSACFPYLKEVCTAAAEIDTEPLAIIRELREEGLTEIDDIFPEFSRRGGVYGFGDLQVQRLLERLTAT